MAYARARGNQLLIVHGVRDPESMVVSQRILFTFYSKAEAKIALGIPEKLDALEFQSSLEDKHPDIEFEWKTLKQQIIKNLDHLPEVYEQRGMDQRSQFRKSICDFARELVSADPELNEHVADYLLENQQELRYLSGIIDWRLKVAAEIERLPDSSRTKVFAWLSSLYRKEVPPDIEETAAEFLNKGEWEYARVVFKLLTEAFEDYAEGYNYLGIVALGERKLEEAVGWFEKTIEVGRSLFPKRLAKSSYWTDLRTRPYMRGLRNLAVTLNRLGRYDEALGFCQRLETECGDEIAVYVYRSAIFLNQGKYQAAFENSKFLHRIYPTESLKAAFACFELGERDEASVYFLHGLLNSPVAAAMLTNERARPKLKHQTRSEAEDYNAGIELLESLSKYLTSRSLAKRRYFSEILADARVQNLISEISDLEEKFQNVRGGKHSEYLKGLQSMKTPEYAAEKCREFFGISVEPRLATATEIAKKDSLKSKTLH